jgi:ATP-dependent Clp protease ATP-binding subunit ClpA
LIQREIENPLALALLDGTFGDGDSIEVDAGDEGLAFRPMDNATA